MYLLKSYVRIDESSANRAVHQGLHSQAKISRTCESGPSISRLRFPALQPRKSGETQAYCGTRIGFQLQHGISGAADLRITVRARSDYPIQVEDRPFRGGKDI